MEQIDHQKETTILDYAKVLWRRKAVVLLLFTASVVITMVVSLLSPKYYKSEAMILAIAPESGGLSAALSASPLAGALGGSLGGLSSPVDRTLVFLKSRTVAEMVIKQNDLLRALYASKWDAEKGAWMDPARPPLMEDAVKRLAKNIASFKKTREGSITITVEWKDPKLAAQIANYYVVALAEIMKNKSVNTTVQIVDPAVPAQRKSSPKVALNMVMAGILSLFMGVLAVFILESMSKKNKA